MEETWIIYKLNQYGTPKIETREVKGWDIQSAIMNSGIVVTEIICVKLKSITETIVNI